MLVSSPGGRQPAAEGSLAKTPFAHVLLYLLQEGLSGTLVLRPAASPEVRVKFEKGIPTAVGTSGKSARDTLLTLFLDADSPYTFYAEEDLLGHASSVERTRVDPVALITASLRFGARSDVVDTVVARWGRTKIRLRPSVDLRRFAFEPHEQSFVEFLRATPASVAELANQSGLPVHFVHRLVYLLTICKALEVYQPSAAEARERPATAAPTQRRKSAEHSLREAIEVRKSKAAAPKDDELSAILGADAARRVKSAEHSLRVMLSGRPDPAQAPTRGGPKRSMAPSPSVMPAPPGIMPLALQARWMDITARAVGIDGENYFQMLEVPRDADTQTIREAYFGLVKTWHPDRLPPELGPLKPYVERIFHYLTEAHGTLADESKRALYMRAVQEGGGTPASERQIKAVVQASVEFQKAEVMLRRKDYKGAMKHVDAAIDLYPEDSDYHATKGWLLHQLNPGADAPFQAIISALDEALAINEQSERAHFYRGVVLKRMNRDSEALDHFRRAVELNPKNVDAQREIRLAEMRGQGKPLGKKSDTQATKLLERLFGRKPNT